MRCLTTLLPLLPPFHLHRRRRKPKPKPANSPTPLHWTAVGLLAWSHLLTVTLADCECGYVSSIGDTTTLGSDSGSHALFTELFETDFTSVREEDIAGDNSTAGGWVPQAFNLSRERARGEFGEMFAVGNVGAWDDNRDRDQDRDGDGVGGGSGQQQQGGKELGLKLVVRKEVVEGMVPVAEVDSQRLDVFWGTFRASMRMTGVGGTCAAFFWYFNDTQEIDMEFLSNEFNTANRSYPVNLVLQSHEAAIAGYNAALTGNFVKAYLPFNPAEDFHEYRIDYLPGRVFFYADGLKLAEMDGPAVPSSPGHLILQHWSNGNKLWSGGPPIEDSALTVRYVKAYFNSSTAKRQRDWETRCRDPTATNAVCRIPDVTLTNSSAAAWFFKNQGNMTNNQTISGQNDGAGLEMSWWRAVWLVLFVSGWVTAL